MMKMWWVAKSTFSQYPGIGMFQLGFSVHVIWRVVFKFADENVMGCWKYIFAIPRNQNVPAWILSTFDLESGVKVCWWKCDGLLRVHFPNTQELECSSLDSQYMWFGEWCSSMLLKMWWVSESTFSQYTGIGMFQLGFSVHVIWRVVFKYADENVMGCWK